MSAWFLIVNCQLVNFDIGFELCCMFQNVAKPIKAEIQKLAEIYKLFLRKVCYYCGMLMCA